MSVTSGLHRIFDTLPFCTVQIKLGLKYYICYFQEKSHIMYCIKSLWRLDPLYEIRFLLNLTKAANFSALPSDSW